MDSFPAGFRRCVLDFFSYIVISFSLNKKRLQFTPKVFLPRCLRTPGVLAGHINISLSFLINLCLLPFRIPNLSQPSCTMGRRQTRQAKTRMSDGWRS